MSRRVWLTFMCGPSDGETVELEADGDPAVVMIGRLASCALPLPHDPEVSRQHARLAWRDGSWWLEDCGSSNGVFTGEFASERRLSVPVALRAREVFRVGRMRMRIEDGPGSAGKRVVLSVTARS